MGVFGRSLHPEIGGREAAFADFFDLQLNRQLQRIDAGFDRLEGHTGIGKSEIVAQVARDLDVGFIVLDLSLLEPPDLVGLPVITRESTTYAPPAILPRDGDGILMLEELNRAERYIQHTALQLLTARRLHEYELPEGWSVCAAINPEDDKYQVTPLDPALRARFVLANVAPWVLAGLLGERRDPADKPVGAQLKVNFLLDRLPRLASGADPRIAFAGTLHLSEDYPELDRAYADAAAGRGPLALEFFPLATHAREPEGAELELVAETSKHATFIAAGT